jgi:hypothetical protein
VEGLAGILCRRGVSVLVCVAVLREELVGCAIRGDAEVRVVRKEKGLRLERGICRRACLIWSPADNKVFCERGILSVSAGFRERASSMYGVRDG